MHVGPDELSMWGDLGEKMIVLSAESDQHMKDLELMAKNLRLPCHMIDVKVYFCALFQNYIRYSQSSQDEQMRKAVLGIFGEEREVNKVTVRLKVVT